MATNRAVLPERGPLVAIPGHLGNLEVARVDVRRREAIFEVKTADGVTELEQKVMLSMIAPLSEEDSVQFWQMLVDDLMRVLKEEGQDLSFVKGYEVTTDEDSTGDPAVYIRILVAPERRYSPATVARWRAFSDLLHECLMSLRLQRYPYISIGEKRRRR